MFSILLAILSTTCWIWSRHETDVFTIGGHIISQPRSWRTGNISYSEGFEVSTCHTAAQSGGKVLIGAADFDPIDRHHFFRMPAMEMGILEWEIITGDNEPKAYWELAGVHFLTLWTDLNGQTRWDLVIPDWYLICASLVLPAIASYRALRYWRRSRGGKCISCGYDLRATPERCPECGAIAGKTGESAL